MMDHELAIRWIIFQLPMIWLYRRIKGGLWVNFENGSWEKTKWADKTNGYIINTYDGGTYSKKFKLITKIEDYT